MSPAKSQPQSAAMAMDAIAEPGRAKPTGKPDMRAPTMRRMSRARKRSSMAGPGTLQTAPTPALVSASDGSGADSRSPRITATFSRK